MQVQMHQCFEIISKQGARLDPGKLNAVRHMPALKSKRKYKHS